METSPAGRGRRGYADTRRPPAVRVQYARYFNETLWVRCPEMRPKLKPC